MEDFHDLPPSVRWALGILIVLVVFKYSIVAAFAFGFGLCTYLCRDKLTKSKDEVYQAFWSAFDKDDS